MVHEDCGNDANHIFCVLDNLQSSFVNVVLILHSLLRFSGSQLNTQNPTWEWWCDASGVEASRFIQKSRYRRTAGASCK